MNTPRLATPVATAQQATFTIALLVFDDMEALDYAGPFEVFTTASRVYVKLRNTKTIANIPLKESAKAIFDVKCIARTTDPVRAHAGMRVLPDATFATPMQADLLLVPGGVVDRAQACPDTLAWVQRMHASSRWTASVCTGAFILARAGVLTNHPVTTHWEDLADLQRQFPALQVHSGVRWVSADGGRLTTSAGISAGIDMSLHLVATMATAMGVDGQDLAERTAHQMEYTWTQQAPNLLTPTPAI